MTDPIIHQLYCTHCTYGTSALHRNTGNIKDQPFEYSTRAGSVDRPTSHETFQRFEKMYFRGLPLPSDTPADARQRLTAHSSPWRRLIAARTTSGNLLAQVAYRTTDTSTPPRTGSYFAHLLLQNAVEPPEPTWSLSDALQMWGADFWVAEERADCSHELKTVSSLQSLPGFGSVINDAALLSFLTTPPDGDFRDGRPGPSRSEPSLKCAIPARWREKPVQERRDLFTALFHSVANLNFERRERLLVAVEPSLAALLFYGIVRLLPHTGLVDQLSVSTFEPHADPFSTILTATDFYNADPARSEQHLAMVRACTAINTYGTRPVPSPPQSLYLSTMLGKFLGWNQGPAAVDRTRMELKGTGKSGLSSLRDCEQYFGASELAERLLRVTPNPVSERDVSALTLDAARQKFRLTLLTQLRSLSKNDSVWMELSQSAHRVLLIAHVLGEEPELPNSADALAQLCDCLPRNELPRFFDDRLISSDLRLKRLQREVIETGQLPAGCDSLWLPPRPGAGTDRPLLEKLFGTLDADKLKAFCGTMFESAVIKREQTSPQMLTMLTCLAKAAKGDADKRQVLTDLLEDKRLNADHWDVLLRHLELRSALLEAYPDDERILRDRLVGLLDHLLESGSKFPKRIDILKAAESRIPGDRRADLSRWKRVCMHIQDLNNLQSAPAGLIDRFVTGTRNSRLRELGASVAGDCQKIVEATPGLQKADRQLQILMPLLRANSSSGQVPASFAAGMMQALRKSEPPEPPKSADPSNPSFVKRLLAWTPTVAAVVLLVAIALGAYVNRDAIMASFKRTHKAEDKESIVAKSDDRSLAQTTTKSSSQVGETSATNSETSENIDQSEPTTESLGRNESGSKMEVATGNESKSKTETATVTKAPNATETPNVDQHSGPDKVHIAEPHDLPLSKLREQPPGVMIITDHATQLTFHSIGTTDSSPAYPRLHVTGNNSTTLKISLQMSEPANDLPLCVLNATAKGVIFTNETGHFPTAVETSVADKLWSVSALGLRTSADQVGFHSFVKHKISLNGWRFEKDVMRFQFDDQVIPAWFPRSELPNNAIINSLAIRHCSLQLPNTPTIELHGPVRWFGPSEYARIVRLDSVFVKQRLFIDACELKFDDRGGQFCFHLLDSQRESFIPANKKRYLPIEHDPKVVAKALLSYAQDLSNLRSRLKKNDLPDSVEYGSICRLFHLDAKVFVPQQLNGKETPEKAKELNQKNADGLKAWKVNVLGQLIPLAQAEGLAGAQSICLHGLMEAKLLGELFLVVDGETNEKHGFKRGIAIKVAEFGEQPVSGGGTK